MLTMVCLLREKFAMTRNSLTRMLLLLSIEIMRPNGLKKLAYLLVLNVLIGIIITFSLFVNAWKMLKLTSLIGALYERS